MKAVINMVKAITADSVAVGDLFIHRGSVYQRIDIRCIDKAHTPQAKDTMIGMMPIVVAAGSGGDPGSIQWLRGSQEVMLVTGVTFDVT